MTLAKTIRTALLVAFLGVAITALSSEIFYLHGVVVAHFRRPRTARTVEGLNGYMRASLPAGSSRIKVETFLRARLIDFHYASPREIDATAYKLKPSNPRAETTLSMRFHFDDHDALLSVDSSAAKSAR